jgi:hypothetical protein
LITFTQILESVWILLTTGMILWISNRVRKLEKERPDKAGPIPPTGMTRGEWEKINHQNLNG